MDKLIRIEKAQLLPELFGALGSHLDLLQSEFKVTVLQVPEGLRIVGEQAEQVDCASQILARLIQHRNNGIEVTPQLVSYLISVTRAGDRETLLKFHPDAICLNAKGKPIVAKTKGQSDYVKAIQKAEVTFGIGPAGTGKTFLAVALAVEAFRQHRVDRIILTRPAVEAGEKLGFLPGDLQMKVDPYMRPLYDALHELMGAEQYLKNQERGLIEVSPLAYMRGRTLDHAFIILDEAQNTTPEQMKMFLTRIGFGSKVVVTGDLTQIDLPGQRPSGLQEARRILQGVGGIQFIELTPEDVVRNGIVQAIIRAYEKAETRQKIRQLDQAKPRRLNPPSVQAFRRSSSPLKSKRRNG